MTKDSSKFTRLPSTPTAPRNISIQIPIRIHILGSLLPRFHLRYRLLMNGRGATTPYSIQIKKYTTLIYVPPSFANAPISQQITTSISSPPKIQNPREPYPRTQTNKRLPLAHNIIIEPQSIHRSTNVLFPPTSKTIETRQKKLKLITPPKKTTVQDTNHKRTIPKKFIIPRPPEKYPSHLSTTDNQKAGQFSCWTRGQRTCCSHARALFARNAFLLYLLSPLLYIV